jgi:TolB-like protein
VRRCWRQILAFLDPQAGDRQSLALALHNDFGAIAALLVWSDGARAATYAESTRPGALSAPQLSIVVLPFANLSGDPEQEYFVDGVTESLTTDLSRISGSFVIGRHTAFTYKGKGVNLKQIGRDLNVRYVLEGLVQRSGNRLQVNVQLVDAETGAHLWADRFDKPIADLFEMQDEIVSRLANALNTQLIEAEARRAERVCFHRDLDHEKLPSGRRARLVFRIDSGSSRRSSPVEREDVEGVELNVSILPARVQRRHDGWSAVPDTVTDRANARQRGRSAAPSGNSRNRYNNSFHHGSRRDASPSHDGSHGLLGSHAPHESHGLRPTSRWRRCCRLQQAWRG